MPAKEAQAQLPDGSDLVPEAPIREPEEHEEPGVGSNDPPPKPIVADSPPEADDDQPEAKERRARKKEELPRKEYRDRLKHKDEGSGEHPNDWTRFQIQCGLA